MAGHIFNFLIFPGLLFASIGGGFLSWLDRKITARVQFRVGPPLLQPFYDFVKLLAKETIIPTNAARTVFFLAPFLAVAGACLSSVFVLLPAFGIAAGFKGDLIVVFYLLMVPSLAYIIGALASGNPLANLGASREMKLIIGYELSLLLVLAAVILKSGHSISLEEIVAVQQQQGAFIGSLSGILLFIPLMMCVQAKLAFVPFDIADAETEIAGGIFIEFSGMILAMVKLAKYIMLFVLPSFVVVILLGGFRFEGIHILWSVLKLLGVVLVITLVRNTNPRLTVGQSMRFFFVWMNLIAVIAIVLAYFGF
jgi:NADH-quinone oxidoreductase subunit H